MSQFKNIPASIEKNPLPDFPLSFNSFTSQPVQDEYFTNSQREWPILAQLVVHRTGNAKVVSSNPIEARLFIG